MNTNREISRKIELSAIRHLQNFYGTRAKVVDLGLGPDHDFEIFHSDKTLALGETTWLENDARRSMTNAIEKLENQNLVKLSPGSGCWSVRLEHGAHVNTLKRALPKLVFAMIALEQLEYRVHESWRKDVIAEECRRLEILHIQPTRSISLDVAFIRPNGGGGIIPSNYSGLAEKIVELLAGVKRSKWKKLIDRDKRANENHLYLRLGTLIPPTLWEPLLIDNPEHEISDIGFPDGITHIWLEGGGDQMRNILWSKDNGNFFF